MKATLFTGPTTEPIASGERSVKRPRQSGVYQILCKPTGKVYVGSAVWLAKRKRHHREALLSGRHHSPYLQRAWNKYGPASFEFTVLEYCEPARLIEVEQKHLDALNAAAREHGFNLNPHAGSNLGRTFGPEMRSKLSAARKGKPSNLSPEQIEELRGRMEGNSFRLGIPHTAECRERMKETNKGKRRFTGHQHTEESRRKMSKTRKGNPLSIANRIGISQALRGVKKNRDHVLHVAVAQARLKPEQCEAIRQAYVPGLIRMQDLAARYGCSKQTICNVINRSTMVYR